MKKSLLVFGLALILSPVANAVKCPSANDMGTALGSHDPDTKAFINKLGFDGEAYFHKGLATSLTLKQTDTDCTYRAGSVNILTLTPSSSMEHKK